MKFCFHGSPLGREDSYGTGKLLQQCHTPEFNYLAKSQGPILLSAPAVSDQLRNSWFLQGKKSLFKGSYIYLSEAAVSFLLLFFDIYLSSTLYCPELFQYLCLLMTLFIASQRCFKFSLTFMFLPLVH